jgi:phage terminase small subunit
MARHKQPDELAKLKGADKKNPQRYLKVVPKSPSSLGSAPNHLTPDVAKVWEELVTYALPGVLTGADRFVMEIAASLLAEFRCDRAEFAAAKYSHLIGCLARLGLTPADRQKLGTAPPQEENPFDGF